MSNVIYHFHPTSREFLGAGLADASPLEPGVLLLPANSTSTKPPAAPAGSVLKWDGEWVIAPMPAPSTADILSQYTAAIQARLDAFARTRNYDGILSACTYATSGVPRFAAEGQYAVSARDATWAAGYSVLADVEAGNRPAPTLDELMAELPALTWPE